MREGIFDINPFNHCRFSGGALVLISRRPMIQNAAPNRMRRGVEDNVLAKLRRRNCTFDDVQQTVLNFGGKLLTAIFNKLRVGFKAYDAKALFEIVFGILAPMKADIKNQVCFKIHFGAVVDWIIIEPISAEF